MAGRTETDVGNDQFFSKYDNLISKSITDNKVPGISIAVVNGEKTFSKSYGIASYSSGEKVTPDTLFNIASMSKSFIAAALSLLVDDDENFPEVQWSTPVCQLIRDDFVLSDSRTEMVTIEDILSHRSGLADQDDAFLGVNSQTPDTPKSVTRKLRHLPLTAPLRTKYQYCNVMFVVAVHLIETLAKTDIADFLEDKIWQALQMADTQFGVPNIIAQGSIDQLSKGYRWMESSSSFHEVPWPIQPEAAGAGEIHSTVLDIARYLRCMIEKATPISQDGHDELITPRTISTCKPFPFHSHSLYALGWEVESYHGETVIGHGGSTNGFGSKMIYIPRLEWGIVLLGNSADAYGVNERICWTMVDDLLGVDVEKRFDWDKWMKEDMEEQGFKSLEELYPNIPEARLPLTLPVDNYAGKYNDVGYGTLTMEFNDGKLRVDCTDRTWRFMLDLVHVSGEFFVAELVNVDTLDKFTTRARFEMGVDGEVSRFGLGIVEEMGDEMIWFRRIK